MKKLTLLFLAVGLVGMAGCSKSDKVEVTTAPATPQSTPDAARLKSESERLQQATANAARQREVAQAGVTPTPTPTATP